MFNLLIAAEGNSNSSIIMIVVMVAILILMPLISYFPQRKRKKAAEEMMKSVRVGKKIRTIGGFVGEIVALDDKNATMELNVGSKEAPVIVNMYQGAIDTVLNPDIPLKEQQNTKPEDNVTAPVAVTAEDAAQDAIIAEKAAEKKAKKDAKKKQKADKKAESAQQVAGEAESEGVVENNDAVDAEISVDTPVENAEK